jgi:hypothetical protein
MRPSGLAVAPKVASAPRGPRFGSLAGNPVQSLPQAASIRTPISVSVRSKVQRIKLYLQTVEIPNHFHPKSTCRQIFVIGNYSKAWRGF